MRPSKVKPTGIERVFDVDEIIVTKTNTRGIVTYANDVFLQISAYEEAEVIGKPHNLIRHPDMPRAVFDWLWTALPRGEELFAYIVNLAGDGAHYWVLAHITPSFDTSGRIIGYHSNRRLPHRRAIEEVSGLYEALCREEARHTNPKHSIAASTALFEQTLASRCQTYEEYVWDLTERSMAVA